MRLRKIPLTTLILLTMFAGFVTSFTFASDPEAKLLGAEIGGPLLLFAAPFWVIYRGKIPFAMGLFLAMLLYIGVVYLNCWAATQAETRYTHPGDWISMGVSLIPGLATAFIYRAIKRSGNS